MFGDDETRSTALESDAASAGMGDLAALVDDAVKALSIGGTYQPVDEVRRAVGRLKDQTRGDGRPRD